MKTAYKRGFTLIELLVVIAIIGLLSSVVLASLNSARRKGRDARRVADIKQLQLALELYYDANGQYPTALTVATLVTPGYMSVIPNDPNSGASYAYVGLQGSASSPATCASYHIGARLEQPPPYTTGPLAGDANAQPGGTFGSGFDGPVCTGSAWGGSADIPASASDFSGTNPVYDMRP